VTNKKKSKLKVANLEEFCAQDKGAGVLIGVAVVDVIVKCVAEYALERKVAL